MCLFTILIFKQVSCQPVSASSDTIDNCRAGNEFFNNYQFDRAVEMLSLCYQSDVKNIDCLKKIAHCNYKLGRLKEAKSNYFKILEYDSANLTAINQLGVIYSKESLYNKSIEQYEILIAIDSTNSFYHKQIGILSLKLGNIKNSIQYFEKALNINPQDIMVIAELSSIYQKLNQYTKADSLIAKGLILDSTNVKLLLTQSKIAYKQKKYETVINAISQILKFQNDTSIYMMKLLGISHFHLNDYKNTIMLMEKVIKNKQGSEVIHYYLGLAYRANGDFEKSVYHFEQAIDKGITDNISSYYTNLAVTYEEMKNFKESIKAYQTAYKSSKNKILLYHLARNYDAYYKDKEIALRYYEKYVTMNDTDNIEFKDYSKHRISELKEIIHFELDTLN